MTYPTLTQVVLAVSNPNAIKLLHRLEFDEKYDSPALIHELKLSRKQYYTMIARLSEVGIINRRGGYYNLTMFGKVIAEVLRVLEDETILSSKTRRVDITGTSEHKSIEETPRLINA